MKILIHCPLPFALAHGGHQIQIARTQAALQSLGLQVEPLRWWDEKQTADLIHYFGRMPVEHIKLAHQKGIKVVMADLIGGMVLHSASRHWLHRVLAHATARSPLRPRMAAFSWESYLFVDACVALTPWEAHLMRYLLGAPRERIAVVPNGVEEVFLNGPRVERGRWLVCTATVTKIKRVVELAKAAVKAQTPLWDIQTESIHLLKKNRTMNFLTPAFQPAVSKDLPPYS
jgi:hypothetical protein